MKKGIILVSLFAFFCCASSQGLPRTAIEKALHNLGESLVESCPICVQQLRKEAFALLRSELPAGKTITLENTRHFAKISDHALSLVIAGEENRKKGKTDAGIDYELPIVIFRYHTVSNHMSGIATSDFTEPRIAAELAAIPDGKAFSGTIITIPFRYAQGDTFVYSPKENTLTVHCKVINIAHTKK